MKKILTIALIIGSVTSVSAQTKVTSEDNSSKGTASFYHPKFNGRLTATGEVFANTNYTAASNHIRLGSYVKVTNLNNGRVCYVKVNDRMSPNNHRLVDLTSAAADKLGYRDAGLTKVKMEIVTAEEGRTRVLAQRDISTASRNTL
jgi:rare lipoprotein A